MGQLPTKFGFSRFGKMVENRDEWIVIGISGVTCGGKTTLANSLQEILAPVYVFHQDKYFYPDDSPKHVKCKGIDHNNYDILGALDMETMYEDVLNTIKGVNKAHDSCLETDQNRHTLPGKKFLIVEGFTVLNYKPLNELCDLRYYFVLDYGECAARRCHRLYDPPDVDGYFDQCVWPEHLKYRAEIEQDRRVKIINGTNNAMDLVLQDLHRLGASRRNS